MYKVQIQEESCSCLYFTQSRISASISSALFTILSGIGKTYTSLSQKAHSWHLTLTYYRMNTVLYELAKWSGAVFMVDDIPSWKMCRERYAHPLSKKEEELKNWMNSGELKTEIRVSRAKFAYTIFGVTYISVQSCCESGNCFGISSQLFSLCYMVKCWPCPPSCGWNMVCSPKHILPGEIAHIM